VARIVLRPVAREDLKAIGRYSADRWGESQRRWYLRELADRMAVLADNPMLGRARDDLRAGYRSMRSGRHVVFYREVADGIEIVRVLHQSMDVSRHLPKA
jgi:toxin ParE1/3/4